MKRNGSAAIWWYTRTARRVAGDLGDDEDHQDTVEDQDAALQRGDLVGCGLHDFLYAADHDQDRSRHQ